MIISARLILRPRTRRSCADCRAALGTGWCQVRLYGSADGEKPWTLYLCTSCLDKATAEADQPKLFPVRQRLRGYAKACALDSLAQACRATEVGPQ